MTLASGAWAAGETYTYTWTIKINHIDDGFEIPSDLMAYLVDKDQPMYGQPMGYYNWVSVAYKSVKDNIDKYSKGWNETDGNYGYLTYKFEAKELIPESSLYTVLSSDMLPGEAVWLKTDYSGTSGFGTFGVVAEFHDVPEPTSGLLLLLGVAGLALKRKKAA